MAKKIAVKTGEQKKIPIKSSDSPELVAVFNPWQRAKELAGATEAKIEASLKTQNGPGKKDKEQWRWGRIVVVLAIVGLIAFGGVTLYRHINRPASPLSADLQCSLPFSPYIIPKDNTSYYTYNYHATNAEGQAKILSFDIITPDNITVTLSEYPQPPQFSSTNGYKAQFLSSVIQQYATIKSKSGTLYLGRATGAGDKQVAAMTEHGLLVLMSSSKDMNNSQWSQLGDQLVIAR